MSKNAYANKHVLISRKCDTSRFMTLDVDVCRGASWYEALGALTLGSMVVSTVIHPQCNGMRGDLEALGADYHRVGKRSAPAVSPILPRKTAAAAG